MESKAAKEELSGIIYGEYSSPIGTLLIGATATHLCKLQFASELDYRNRSAEKNEIIKRASIELNEYFKGTRRTFTVPCKPHGTDFQMSVWKSLLDIPYGETLSYSGQAISINNPKAVRAVGRANGQNPICIIYPCHRVVGKSGSMTGYAGGIEAKEFLLRLEAS